MLFLFDLMKHYKYIHFLWSDELKFQRPIVEMINDSDGYFYPQDHLFLTPSEMVKNTLGHYPNVVFYQNNNQTMADIINHYGKYADWMVSHGMANHVYQIKREYLRKIVWRTWGGSRQKSKWNRRHFFYSIYGQCVNAVYYLFYRYSYGCSPVIGIANTVDVLDLEQWNWHKRSKLFFLNYGSRDFDILIQQMNDLGQNHDNSIKILVGHQGSQIENHVEYVNRILNSYNDESFDIYLPLSYGDARYIAKVKKELELINDSRIHVIDSLMPIGEYLKFLASIDVAIFDGNSSMALGNIGFLIRFKKKIILNNSGVLKKAFDRDQLPYGTCDKVGTIPFSELVAPIHYREPLLSDIAYQPYEKQVQDWASMFNYLDSLRDNG